MSNKVANETRDQEQIEQVSTNELHCRIAEVIGFAHNFGRAPQAKSAAEELVRRLNELELAAQSLVEESARYEAATENETPEGMREECRMNLQHARSLVSQLLQRAMSETQKSTCCAQSRKRCLICDQSSKVHSNYCEAHQPKLEYRRGTSPSG